MIIIGFHAIETLIDEGKTVHAIFSLDRQDSDRLKALKQKASKARIAWKDFPVKDRAKFEAEFRRLGGDAQDFESAQSVFAQVPEPKFWEISELLKQAREKEENPILLFLDSVTDPQNLGSMLRSGAFFNIAGLVLTEHRSSPLTAAAIKISSGGFAHIPISRVVNLAQAIEMAKEAGFWIVGLSEHATESFYTARLDAPIVLVIGNEEKGIRPLTAKNCDYTLSLPALGPIQSLNAAVASAVALTLVRERQRQISELGGEEE